MAAVSGNAAEADEASGYGNIVQLEHVNLNSGDPEAAITFYLQGLGGAQDPRMGELVDGTMYLNRIMWANFGMSQFHLPFTSRGASGPMNQTIRGRIGLDVPSLALLRDRLAALTGRPGAPLRVSNASDGLEITGPTGAVFLARERDESARDTRGYHPGPASWCIGIPFVELRCPVGSSPGIARYYRHYIGAEAEVMAPGVAKVSCGPAQHLVFVEDEACEAGAGAAYQEQDYGLHVCIYLRDHAGPMRKLWQDDLLWGNPRFYGLDRSLGLSQFRCKDIVDPLDTARPRRVLLELEHEVRVLEHNTSPFRSGPRPKTYAAAPAMVSTVTDEYEIDFMAKRAAGNAETHGFIPTPPSESKL